MGPLVILIWIGMVLFLLFLVLIPVVLVSHLAELIRIPKQLYQVASNPRLRKNHALEHATLNILERRYGCVGLSGISREDGFMVKGRVSPDVILKAAQLGLEGLKSGQTDLAVHQGCGTSRAAASFGAAALLLVLIVAGGLLNVFTLLVLGLFLILASPAIGVVFQRYLTTDPHVEHLSIRGIHRVSPPASAGFMFFPALLQYSGYYFVKTEQSVIWEEGDRFFPR